jgi:hypothetical protein
MTLGEIAERTEILHVARRKCERRGRYHLARLIERYGADGSAVDFLQEISADGPKRNNLS